MVLSKRLTAVARFVPAGSVIADIGTDHVYLPVYLLQQGNSPRSIASDVNQGPLDIARLNVQAYGLAESIDLRRGEGLAILKPGEADVIVIAGMGGRTICGILERGRAVLEQIGRLILQPMGDVLMVRRWLNRNGWRLVEEEMLIEEKHFYVILAAEPGQETIDDDFILQVGPRLLEKKHPVLKIFLAKRLTKIQQILINLAFSGQTAAINRTYLLRREAAKIKEVLSKWQL